MIDKHGLIALTQKLIQIRSENPPGEEAGIARFIKLYFEALGLKPRIYEFKKNRSNIVLTMPGVNQRHSLLITPHLDTVPAGSHWIGVQPFSGQLLNGRVYGRGASDDKGNLAVSLEVIKRIIKQRYRLNYNLIFAATADEETGSRLGLIPLLQKKIIQPDAALILDSDAFKIIIVQKGLIHMKIRIKGKSAHGAYPWQGVSAINAAVKVLHALRSYRLPFKKNPYLRAPTINIGTIAGGDKVNIVADWCEFELDIRFLPGMPVEQAVHAVKRFIKRRVKDCSIELMAVQSPAAINPSHPLVRCFKKSICKYHIEPRVTGSEGATVITFLQEKNIPAIATGFGCSGCAHSSKEYITTRNLLKGALVLEDFLKRFSLTE